MWWYCIFLALPILLFLVQRQITRIRNTPIHTPPTYPILGCLISYYKNRHRLLDFFIHYLSQSPTQTILINRLGARRTILTANPLNVEYMLKTNFKNYPKGKSLNELLYDLLGSGIFIVDGKLWSDQRKQLSHEFSTRSLKDFVGKTLEDEVQGRLIPLLESASNDNLVIDMQDVLTRLAFEIVCQLSLGYDPCCLDLSKPFPPLLSSFEKATAICAMRAASPITLVWKIKRMFNVGSEKSLKEAVKVVHESIMEIIRKKKKDINEKKYVSGSDLLTRLLEAGEDEIMVRDMITSIVLAGRDSTAAAMTWFFWVLSRNRSKEELIVKGVREAVGGKNNKNEFEVMKSFDYDDLKKMTYLKACLCESMRMYAPVAWDSKFAADDDVLPDGTKVGKGDKVTYFSYGMGRMEALWGKDWNEFKPDRWLEEAVKEGGDPNGVLKHVSPYKFAVFHAGPRVCLGKDMAFIQMEYVVASILNRFELKPVLTDEPVYIPYLTAHMAGGFKVRVHKRV